jgi:hypothetical protein
VGRSWNPDRLRAPGARPDVEAMGDTSDRWRQSRGHLYAAEGALRGATSVATGLLWMRFATEIDSLRQRRRTCGCGRPVARHGGVLRPGSFSEQESHPTERCS